MEIYIGQDKGRWPKGTRVKKISSEPGDTHHDDALGTIVGAWGPLTASQRAELIIKLAKKDATEDIECIYWVVWDDIPGIPVAIADYRIEPILVYAKGSHLVPESCLSIPGKAFTLRRARIVKIRGLTLDNVQRSFRAHGLLAQVFQHELNHLDGILIDQIEKRR